MEYSIVSEHVTSVQRLPNVLQTSMMFGQRWVDAVTTQTVHWVVRTSKKTYRISKR